MNGVVVVGAGLAGLRTCESLRGQGYREPIVLVGEEEHLPYDRPPLSKQLLVGKVAPERLTLRTAEELAELDVQFRRGRRAVRLELEQRRVLLDNGEELPFDDVVLATGAAPIHLPGADVAGVHVLRSLDDALRLREVLAGGPRVVVVGAGFIGLEVAASARGYDADVTVLDLLPHPLARVLPKPVGQAVQRMHEGNGVRFRLGSAVAEIVGDPVTAVVLADGERLPADVVVAGIGVRPATGWLADSGLTVEDGVVCDEALRAAPGVWAAGDVARWALPGGRNARLEHWTNAAEQAQAVATAIARGAAEPFVPVPYFWSDHYRAKLQSLGYPTADDEVRLVSGDLSEERWMALLHAGDRVTAVIGLRSAARVMKARGLLAAGTGLAEALDALQ